MNLTFLTPNLEVSNVKDSVSFYEENLGFNMVMIVPANHKEIEYNFKTDKEYIYALIQKDNVMISFERSDSFKKDVSFAQGFPLGASVSFYINIEGICEFHQDMKSKNLQITELKAAWYGMQEFYLKDLNGYILCFAEKA